jgi:hypothetical protein
MEAGLIPVMNITNTTKSMNKSKLMSVIEQDDGNCTPDIPTDEPTDGD